MHGRFFVHLYFLASAIPTGQSQALCQLLWLRLGWVSSSFVTSKCVFQSLASYVVVIKGDTIIKLSTGPTFLFSSAYFLYFDVHSLIRRDFLSLSSAGVQLDTSPIANGYRKLCWAIIIFAFFSPAGYKKNEILR